MVFKFVLPKRTVSQTTSELQIIPSSKLMIVILAVSGKVTTESKGVESTTVKNSSSSTSLSATILMDWENLANWGSKVTDWLNPR